MKLRPFVYFSAGLNRSASTWLYNAMRLMLETAYPGKVYGSLPGLYDAANPRPVHLMKVHQVNEGAGINPVFTACSHRHLVDILRSLHRMGWAKLDEPNALYIMDRIVADHTYWSQRADFEFAYEDFMKDSGKVLHGLHAAMNIELPEDELARIAGELKNISESEVTVKKDEIFDPVTLLHPKHVSRPTDKQPEIPLPVVRAMEERYAAWFERYGYASSSLLSKAS